MLYYYYMRTMYATRFTGGFVRSNPRYGSSMLNLYITNLVEFVCILK